MTSISEEQGDILRHMLGIDKPEEREPKAYRNYYCANHDDQALHALAELGLVKCYRRDDHYEWFTCTEAGIAAAHASHRAIRYPKRKRVYLKFLHISDVAPDLTFHEFLTSPHFAEVRRSA